MRSARAVIALAPSGHAESRARLPFTPDAKRVLEAALNAATALAAQRIESTHVLLGLTSNPEFTSARALASMGIDLAKVRGAVLRG
jgi:ATP-dependent Clp protease ATP-binding subunit ClpC